MWNHKILDSFTLSAALFCSNWNFYISQCDFIWFFRNCDYISQCDISQLRLFHNCKCFSPSCEFISQLWFFFFFEIVAHNVTLYHNYIFIACNFNFFSHNLDFYFSQCDFITHNCDFLKLCIHNIYISYITERVLFKQKIISTVF